MARRSTPGIRTPNLRGGGMRKARTKTQSPTGPSSRGARVMKAAKIAQGGVSKQGIRSVGRGGVVTKDTTTSAAFRARAPVDKTEPARMAAARAAGMKVGLPTSRPVGSRPVGSVGLPIATSRPVGRRKVARRVTSRGSSRR